MDDSVDLNNCLFLVVVVVVVVYPQLPKSSPAVHFSLVFINKALHNVGVCAISWTIPSGSEIIPHSGKQLGQSPSTCAS